MSLAEAGRLLGMQGSAEAIAKRLRRVLMAKEREAGTRFMMRSGGEKQPRYLVTKFALLTAFGNRKSVRETTERVLREKLARAFDAQEELRAEIGRLVIRVRQLEEQCRKVLRGVS
jgi:hypothetical protein